MSFERVIGHERQKDLLKRAIGSNLLAHAILFTGLKGVGKSTLALATARSVLCSQNVAGDACGVCDSCLRFDREQHPDFLEVKPRRKDIIIDQIREVQYALRIGPSMGAARVILIRESSSMNPYASNALLKTLEEPSKGNYLFLTVEDERELLPTIVSRCQRIRLSPLAEPDVAVNLEKQRDVSHEMGLALARLSGGSYGRALALISGEEERGAGILAYRRHFIEKLHTIHKNDSVGLLVLAQELDKLKDDVIEFLEMLKTWFHDLLLCRCGVNEEQFANADLTDLIIRYGPGEDPENIYRKLQWIENSRRTILSNGNRLLTLEVLLFRMTRI
jgi:DNA polymerase III subunit delta'